MKIKILFTLLLAFLIVSITNAEAPKRRGGGHRPQSKGFIAFSVGVGIPLNEYAKADSIQGSGFAKIGVDFNVTAGYKFLPFIGAMAMVGGTINGYNTDALAKMDSTHPIYTAKSYYIIKYMVGPFLYFTRDKVDINFHALAGVSNVFFPTLTHSTSKTGYSSVSTIEIPAVIAFGYDVGASANIKITKTIGFLINIDYYGSKLTYSNIKSTSDIVFTGGITTNSQSIDTTKYGQVISLFNCSVGLSINF